MIINKRLFGKSQRFIGTLQAKIKELETERDIMSVNVDGASQVLIEELTNKVEDLEADVETLQDNLDTVSRQRDDNFKRIKELEGLLKQEKST